jgi:hypothetical protein
VLREGLAAGPTGSLQYLNELTYRLELCLTTEQHSKLELARDLLSHANPSGNLSVVVERALDLLIAQQQGRQFGVTQRRRSHRNVKQAEDAFATTEATRAVATTEATRAVATTEATRAVATTEATRAVATTEAPVPAATAGAKLAATRADEKCGAEKSSVRTKSSGSSNERRKHVLRRGPRAHISSEIRRQLFERDGFCCSYMSPTGERCQCRRFLQIHHEKAWAKGGPDTLENLRLLCAEHNRLLGELEFGRRREQVPA